MGDWSPNLACSRQFRTRLPLIGERLGRNSQCSVRTVMHRRIRSRQRGGTENLAHSFGKARGGERLDDQVDPEVEPALMDYRVAGISGGVKYFEARMPTACFFRHLTAVHATR